MVIVEQYIHTLIASPPEFAPQPQQVVVFLNGLTDLNCTPLQATMRVGKLSGQFRVGRDPLTGEVLRIPRRDYAVADKTSGIRTLIDGLNDYDIIVSGEGPPNLQPLALEEFDGPYGFNLHICLRSMCVSTSDPHPEVSPTSAVPLFGEPCEADNRTGFFHHPHRGTIIEVPEAGCARFWIAFEFGKWLLPVMEDSLNLLDPSVVALARRCFATNFAQGCYLL